MKEDNFNQKFVEESESEDEFKVCTLLLKQDEAIQQKFIGYYYDEKLQCEGKVRKDTNVSSSSVPIRDSQLQIQSQESSQIVI